MPIKVKYVLDHVIQYYAPLLKCLAERPELELEVIFGTDAGAQTYFDALFGQEIAWDRPLLTGYNYTVLKPGSPIGPGFWGAKGSGIGKHLTPDRTEVVIVHGWGNHFYVSAILTALRRGLAVLNRMDAQVNYRGRLLFRPFKPLLTHPLLRSLDGQLVVGTRNRRYYLDAGVKPERLFEAPFSVDTPFFRPERVSAEEVKAEEARLGLEPGSFRVIFVGKLYAIKRPEDIIEAVARMPSRSRVEVLLVGDGALRPAVEKLARAREVRAHFLGFRNQSELPGLYALADVNVLSSSHDAWGLVINEGMSMGVPAIVSDMVGCGPDLVEDGRTGYIFKVGDVDGLARALEKVASDAGHLRQLKQAALERIEGFSLDRTVEGYLNAIQTVAARRRSGRASARAASRPGDDAINDDAG
jgi:glycosyltransferase involved in cell wall biosynthesis